MMPERRREIAKMGADAVTKSGARYQWTSEKAKEAYRNAVDRLHIYPDGKANILRAAVAERYKLEPERLTFGDGSDEIFALLCQVYLEPGDNIVQGEHGFAAYAIGARACQAEVRMAKEINHRIDAREVRLIDQNGEQAGVMPLFQAKRIAEDAELDLVEISPTAKPPVCRIMDYGKFRFEQQKKAAEARKKQKQIQVKEVKFRPGTDEGDYQVKLRNLVRFLTEGDKAKITLRFRGREVVHQDIGLNLLKRIEDDLAEFGTVEQRPKMEGRQMIMVVAPKRK